MTRIALFSTGLTQDVRTDLGLAQRLAEVEITVNIHAVSSEGQALANANGVEYSLYRRDTLESVQEVFDALTANAPDAVLCHAALHREQLVAIARGLRVASINTHLSPDRRPDVPPLSSTRMPGGFVRAIAWAQWHRMFRVRYGQDAFRRQVLNLRNMAEALELDFDEIASYVQWQPLSFTPAPALCLAAGEMDFAADDPRETQMLGPALAHGLVEPARDNAEFSALGPWLEGKTPLVYCDLESLDADERLTREIIDAARSATGTRWVFGAAKHATPVSLPDNARTLLDIPKEILLEHASVAIIGANVHSINACVAAEVPAVIYSTGEDDQNGNAARVGWHRLGTLGNRESDTARQINSRIDQVNHESFARRLAIMSEHFAEYDRNQTLAKAVSAFIADDPVSTDA